MFITNNQLTNNLTPDYKVFTVFGEEDLLIKQSLDKIYNHLKTIAFDYKIIFDIGANSNFEAVNNEIVNSSIFSANKIIEIRVSTFAIKIINQLIQLSENIKDGIILIIVFTNNISWQQQKTKWFQTLSANSLMVEHKKIEENQMLNWVVAQMQDMAISSNKKIAEIIAENNIYNLPSAYNELQKIKFVYGSDEIDEELIIKQLSQSSKYSVYNLIDNALLGDSKKVKQIYENLSDDLMYVINLLYNQIKQLININLALKQNININTALTNAGVWKSKINIVKSALKNNSYPKLQKILLELGRVERGIKGRDYIMSDKLLELLLKLTIK